MTLKKLFKVLNQETPIKVKLSENDEWGVNTYQKQIEEKNPDWLDYQITELHGEYNIAMIPLPGIGVTLSEEREEVTKKKRIYFSEIVEIMNKDQYVDIEVYSGKTGFTGHGYQKILFKDIDLNRLANHTTYIISIDPIVGFGRLGIIDKNPVLKIRMRNEIESWDLWR